MSTSRLQRFTRPPVMALLTSALLTLAGGTALAQSPYRLTILGAGVDSTTFVNAYDINNAGQVVLSVGDRPGGSAVVWDGTTFTNLGPGSPTAINEMGQVAGATPTGLGGVPLATLWTNGVASTLSGAGAPNTPGTFSVALDINNRGQVVGHDHVNYAPYATVWQSGGFTSLGLGYASAINNAGQIVGFSLTDLNDSGRATLWNSGIATFLDGTGSHATDINDRGQIIGFNTSAQATLWEGQSAIQLGAPTGARSSISAINNAGLIVGTLGLTEDPFNVLNQRAALWNNPTGTSIDLNTLLRPESVAAGWLLSTATGIDDNGEIVGSAYNRFDCADGTCVSYGFVLSVSNLPDRVLAITTAVPEPSTYALMLAGLSAIGLWAQRRRAASASR
jgi:uncharacterized membrane protein